METTELIAAAAKFFVLPAYQERFIHEAAKKPAKLLARICHNIEEVFDIRFNNGNCKYSESDGCLLFTLTGNRQITTWGQAMQAGCVGGECGLTLPSRETSKGYRPRPPLLSNVRPRKYCWRRTRADAVEE